jgi:hypothetical protein
VVIVHGEVEDLGAPADSGRVLAALAKKYPYPDPADAQYLATDDPAFDVLWAIRPRRAMAWRLDDYDASQGRWRA